MRKGTLLLIVWIWCQGIVHAQTPVPLGFCSFSFDASDTTHHDNTNIEKFLGKSKVQLLSQKEAFLKEFKTQVCLNTNPSYKGWHDYKHLADVLGVSITKEDKNEWLAKIKKEVGAGELEYFEKQIMDDQNIYQHTGFDEKAVVIDFDQNQTPDLVCIPQVHFGPSIGYEVFALKGKSWQSIFDYSGSFEGFEKSDSQIIIRYLVTIIEPSETEILLSVVLEKKESKWVLKHYLKQYYASQTQKPAKFLTEFTPFSTKASTILRTHPHIKDKGSSGHSVMISAEQTKTIVGNQVAIMNSGSKGLVLAKEKGWSFVAFVPNTKVSKTSLEHGMDMDSKEKPYLCGWIQMK